MDEVTLWHGDCLDLMGQIPDHSIDAIITDPPYPEIDREYGRWTEADWHQMMRSVVAHARRVLKPTGSAVFVLQPNSERVGRIRPWLWDFMAWTAREWNQVQDVWWWNIAAIPEAHAIQGRLTRPSVKPCVWLGEPECYRDQDRVLWSESERNKQVRITARAERINHPSGHGIEAKRATEKALIAGGVTPFNLLPIPNTDSTTSAGAHGHGAGTPLKLCDWWTRYICPPDGVILDPFMGSGTTGIAAIRRHCRYIGIEKFDKYFPIAQRRIAKEREKTALIDGLHA